MNIKDNRLNDSKSIWFETVSIKRGGGLWPKLLLLASLVCGVGAVSVRAQQPEPELFTYDELVRLYEQGNLPAPLAEKLKRLLTTPFVNNGATARGVRTLKTLNEAVKDRISDHSPMTVDLPLAEPRIRKSR